MNWLHLINNFLLLNASRLLNTVPLAFVVILLFLISKRYEGFYSINFMLFFIYSWKLNFTGMQVFSVVFIVLRRVLKCRKKGYGANFSFDKPRVNIGFAFWSNRIQDILKKLCVVKVKSHRSFFHRKNWVSTYALFRYLWSKNKAVNYYKRCIRKFIWRNRNRCNGDYSRKY